MQHITRIRYNDDYELLVNEITDYNHQFVCYEDVLLYVNILDGDWRLPYPVELNFIMYHEKTDRYNSYCNYLLSDDTCFHGDDYSYYTFGGYQPVSKDIKGFVIIAISLQYKPTIMKRIKSWIYKIKN